MFHFDEINYWAVFIATIATMVLGFLWYSPVLFGKAWAKQVGLKMEEMSGGNPLTYILTALTVLVGVWILALLLTLTDSRMDYGLYIGLLLGVAVSAKIGMNYLFENHSFALFLITAGYHIVGFVISGLILGAM
ncbi:DUF1761 domain-containing protein [Cohnella luojiensis]|nr:DUF1761 domain-containing protein [Cohnella luojiensis]